MAVLFAFRFEGFSRTVFMIDGILCSCFWPEADGVSPVSTSYSGGPHAEGEEF